METNKKTDKKKVYAAVECEVILFSSQDVVTASGAFEAKEDVFDPPFQSD